MRNAVFAAALCAATPLTAEPVTVIVFDASGSMWNRLAQSRNSGRSSADQ